MASFRPRLSKPYTRATPAELDAASTIGPADIAHAAATWERDAPPALRGLLNASAILPTRKEGPGAPDSGA